jgi:hypothetical protein
MTPGNHPGGLLPPPPPGRDLPRHDRHRQELLAIIRAERTGERRWRVAAWLAPLGAALAVLVIVAGVFVLPGLLGGSKSSGPPPGTGRASPGPAASGGRHGPLERTERSLVSQAVSGLVVRDSVGAVSITGGDRSTVSIAAHLVYRGGAPVVTRTVTGGVLELGYRCPASSRDCGVAFDLVVPRGLGVTVRLGVGQIRLSGLSGTIAVSTGIGQIQAGGMSGPQVRLTTGTGMISAGFTAPPEQVFAHSGIGSVAVRVPSGTAYRVTAKTQIGSVRVSVPRAAASVHVIQATTGTGTVTVARS